MKTSLIRFTTQDFLRLDGLLFEPDYKTNKVIIHVHGTSGDFYKSRMFDTLADKYTKAGYSFLTFNNRGSSTDYRFYKEKDDKIIDRVTIGSANEIFEQCSLDIQSAINFAKNKNFTEIILQGHSYGCNKIIWYALENNFAGKMILLSPCDIKHLYKHKQLESKKANNQANVDMFRYHSKEIVQSFSKLKNNILVEIGTSDDYILQSNKQECIDYLKSAFKNAKVKGHIIENATHSYDYKYQELANNIVEWLSQK